MKATYLSVQISAQFVLVPRTWTTTYGYQTSHTFADREAAISLGKAVLQYAQPRHVIRKVYRSIEDEYHEYDVTKNLPPKA